MGRLSSKIAAKAERRPATMSDFAIEALLKQRPLLGGLSFRCPACGHRLRASVLSVGKSGQCPACAMRIPVPADATAVAFPG